MNGEHMMRYAILWDVEGRASRPAGIVMETIDRVVVAAPIEYGLPTTYSAPYRVLQPDSTDIIYRPGDPQYFDQVLLELSRQFAVADRDTVAAADTATLRHLFQTKVLRQRIQQVRAPYARIQPLVGRREVGAEAVPLRVAASAARRARRSRGASAA